MSQINRVQGKNEKKKEGRVVSRIHFLKSIQTDRSICFVENSQNCFLSKLD